MARNSTSPIGSSSSSKNRSKRSLTPKLFAPAARRRMRSALGSPVSATFSADSGSFESLAQSASGMYLPPDLVFVDRNQAIMMHSRAAARFGSAASIGTDSESHTSHIASESAHALSSL